MALFLLSLNLGWIQGQFNFTENSLHYLATRPESQSAVILSCLYHSPLSVGFAGKRFFHHLGKNRCNLLKGSLQVVNLFSPVAAAEDGHSAVYRAVHPAGELLHLAGLY